MYTYLLSKKQNYPKESLDADYEKYSNNLSAKDAIDTFLIDHQIDTFLIDHQNDETGAYRGFHMIYSGLTDQLRTEELQDKKIKTREKNHLDLMNYPLIKHCTDKSLNTDSSIVYNFMSKIYSKITDQQELESYLLRLINHPIIKDVLLVSAISTQTIEIVANMIDHDPYHGMSGGYSDLVLNRLLVQHNDDIMSQDRTFSVLIHEASHIAMGKLFNNNQLPYKKDDDAEKQFETVFRKVLLNINDFFLSMNPEHIKDVDNTKLNSFRLCDKLNEQSLEYYEAALYENNPYLIQTMLALSLFTGSYTSGSSFFMQIHNEAIVRLPHIIAAELDNPTVMTLLEPIITYWEENTHPETQKYVADYKNIELNTVVALPLDWE